MSLANSIKQTEFLIELARDTKGLGLIRYAIAGMIFVETVGKAFGMEPKELLPSFRFGTPPSLKFFWEAGKAGVDAPDKYGNSRDWKKKLKDIGNSGIGLIPGGIQAKKTIEGYKAAGEAGVYDAKGHQQFPVGTSNAAKTQAILFGKYSSQYAKDYFNKVKTPEQKLKAEKEAAGKKEKEKVQPTFDKAQALKLEGKESEAMALVNSLSNEDYKIYVKIRTSYRAKNTEEVRLKLEIDPKDAVKYVRSLPKAEQDRILSLLTPEEYNLYTSGKPQQ